jgi:serine/threonine protein kinase
MLIAIKDKQYAPLPSNISPFIEEIIKSLLDKNPDSRPSAQELIKKDEIKTYI